VLKHITGIQKNVFEKGTKSPLAKVRKKKKNKIREDQQSEDQRREGQLTDIERLNGKKPKVKRKEKKLRKA